MEFQIRPARQDDGPALQDLIRTVLTEYGLKYDPVSVDFDLADLSKHYPLATSRFYVAEFAGKIVGSSAINALSDDFQNVPHKSCELSRMYLLKQVRGHGLGRKLFELCLQDARSMGYEWMFLETASVLVEALNFYKQNGFKVIESPNITSRCDLVMARQISQIES